MLTTQAFMNLFRTLRTGGMVLLAAGLPLRAAAADPAPAPLPQAHAHNDYEHARPLLDALEHGFMSVEADIWLVDGVLLVAHDRADVKPERTLESLYLDPLRRRAKTKGGTVHPGAGALTLLVDIKGPAAETWTVLRPLLEKYRDILTEVADGAVRERAVTVILSGNRPVAELAKESGRLAFIDGRPDDLEKNPPATLVPLVSAAWSSQFAWRGGGAIPEDQRGKLAAFVAKAHAQGRKVRFWGTRDDETVWEALAAAGVDWINADDLPKLRAWMRKAASDR
jgi:glycerophosphoryl diester phosphodiesterase